jgi:arylsulfatase A-like enzyme
VGTLIAVIGIAFAVAFAIATPHEPPATATAEQGEPHVANRRPPNILLFTIDTLRADHLHAYGYGRDTSPTIDTVAGRGARFTRAYSTASWTLPAVVSLLTGQLPSEHGIVHHQERPDGAVEQDFLAADLPSLPSLLHDAGYRTIGVTSNAHLEPEAGFARGFDDYLCEATLDADDLRAAVWARIDALRDADQPYFLWIHVVDPHMPYRARLPQFQSWWGTTRPRHIALEFSIFPTGIEAAAATSNLTVPEAIEYATAAYDSEIRAVDDFLADLLRDLDDGRLAVVITADHGEELNDHGMMGHGITLFEETVHVPLIVAMPGVPPSVITTPVQLTDVLPTLAETSGGDATGATGRSLLAAMHGATLAPRDLILESGRAIPVAAIVTERYKFGEIESQPEIHRLFDLALDPSEQQDRSDAEPALAADLQRRLHSALDAARGHRRAQATSIEISPEVVDQLRAIGYGN